jgi:hypothetical protein
MKKAFCLLFFLGATLAGADVNTAFVYNEHGKRDPFGPLISPSGTMITYDSDITATDMNLEGIVLDSKGNNLAIINGKIVKAKERLGPYTVEAILNDHVELIQGQEHLTVKFKKGGV